MATKLSELLPIPDGVDDPHAYQVFGLEGGEQDAAKMKAAIKQVYAHLKATKAESDPKLWSKAAKIAERARAVLSDSAERAELDARFGVISAPTGTPPSGLAPMGTPPTGTPPVATTADPLAGMLPSADPLAGMLPAMDPLAMQGQPGTPPSAPPGTPPSAPPGTPPSAPPSAPPGAQSNVPGTPLPSHPAYPHQSLQAGVPQAGVMQQPLPPQAGGYQQPAVGYQQPIGQPQMAPSQPQRMQSPSPVAPVFKPKKSKKRRKKTGQGLFIFFAIAMIVVIGGLALFMFAGPGQVSVTDEGVSLGKPVPQQETTKRPANQTRPRPRPQRNVDPVMGEMSGGIDPPSQTTSTGIPANEFSPPGMSTPPGMSAPPGMSTDDTMQMDMTPPDMSTSVEPLPMEETPVTPPAVSPDMATTTTPPDTSEPTPPPTMTIPEVDPKATLPVSPGTETGPVKMTDEMIAANEIEIGKVKELIRSAKWIEMTPAAEKLTERMLTDEQSVAADALYNLADLATFYRGAIQRGLGAVNATEDFEVAEGFRVLIVEKSHSSLTVRFNAKNKTYSLDEMPFRLADKLASFALDVDKPDSIAAKSAYHAITPLSNDEERKESISWLELINSDVEGVDTKAVAELIKTLFK